MGDCRSCATTELPVALGPSLMPQLFAGASKERCRVDNVERAILGGEVRAANVIIIFAENFRKVTPSSGIMR